MSSPRPAERRALPTLLALGLAAAAGGCATPRLDVKPRALFLEMDGDLEASGTGMDSGGGTVTATGSASAMDLGLDETEVLFSPRVDLVLSPLHVTASFFDAEFEGDGMAPGGLVLDGNAIAANMSVSSRLELGFYDAFATFDVIPIEQVELGIGLGAALADVEARFREKEMGGSTIRDSERVPIPMVAARAGFDVWRLAGSVLVGGLDVEVDDVDVALFDVDAELSFELFEAGPLHGALAAGYRWISIDATFEDSDDELDLDAQFHGPWAGLSIGVGGGDW